MFSLGSNKDTGIVIHDKHERNVQSKRGKVQITKHLLQIQDVYTDFMNSDMVRRELSMAAFLQTTCYTVLRNQPADWLFDLSFQRPVKSTDPASVTCCLHSHLSVVLLISENNTRSSLISRVLWQGVRGQPLM